ncbi:hypothetical protein [Actinomadura livida]|uniref:Uncharacterized protein n=1 Tax=Actinomadura livida TaxID=79909 RepID=A0A7W7IEY5_9ACTN|nr:MULTISPECIES: hypothetical protein [Actinomadura]MBB4775871.1 hypothetical protein [Actinomadura catellatispora]GGU39425.1 hypothetical protein GCM10010208_74610 [Actinomadura livida]
MLEAAIGTIVGAAGIAISVLLGRGQAREAKHRKSIDNFLRVRHWLKTREQLLKETALREYSDHRGGDPNAPGLYRPEWAIDEPVPLEDLRFTLLPEPGNSPPHLDVLRRHWPLDSTGKPLDRYHEAVTAYDAPANWFNGTSYRLMGVEVTPEKHLTLSVTTMKYWDGFDSSAGLVFEAAERYRSTGGKSVSGPYRRRVRDPFNFTGRYCAIGFGVLTVRRAPSSSTFFLHRRDERVAIDTNITGFVPAGEFQPSDDSRLSLETDLDLWRAIMREYAEEFLGKEEVRLRTGAPIAYDRESPFRELQRARRQGSIRLFLLSLHLDPVSWHAQIRVICIINARTFDRIFAEMVSRNTEGMLELPSLHRRSAGPFQGWPLNEETVARYASDPSVGHSTRTCITKVWEHRIALGL